MDAFPKGMGLSVAITGLESHGDGHGHDGNPGVSGFRPVLVFQMEVSYQWGYPQIMINHPAIGVPSHLWHFYQYSPLVILHQYSPNRYYITYLRGLVIFSIFPG